MEFKPDLRAPKNVPRSGWLSMAPRKLPRARRELAIMMASMDGASTTDDAPETVNFESQRARSRCNVGVGGS